MKQENIQNEGQKQLLAWITDRKITRSDLAKMLGTSYRNVWMWFEGRTIPSLRLGVKVENLTKVKCSSWVIPIKSSKKTPKTK